MANYKLAKGIGAALILAAICTTYASAQGCQGLDCAAGFTPPAGHGPVSGTDPRRVINEPNDSEQTAPRHRTWHRSLISRADSELVDSGRVNAFETT
jgi:hypothetical protein